jgi:GNAT superfamily N-acetyltransferase
MMLEIAKLTARDLPAAMHLSTQAGWNQIEADWARLIDLEPDHCLAGWMGCRIVATATLIRYSSRMGWVGMVLVDTEYRGRGFGGQMMDAVLELADQSNVAVLGLDATDAGRPLYVKRGFVDIAGINRRVIAGEDRTDFTGCDIALREQNWAGLLALDREVLRVDRSAFLKRLAGESVVRVIHGNERLIGFGFRRHGRLADQIGPVVAESVDAGRMLIQSLASRQESEPARNVLLDTFRDSALSEWFESMKFPTIRRLMRMIRGENCAESMSRPNVFAAAGLELG